MDSSFAQRYRSLYEEHWWWRARERFLLDRLDEIAPQRGLGRILDVGCGDGLFFAQLLRYGEPEGVEPDADIVTDRGRRLGTIHVAPFGPGFEPPHRYRLILMLDVLEHLADASGALRHAAHLLDEGGTILVTVPAFRSLWTSHDDLNHHLTRYRKRDLVALAATAGLEVRALRYFFHWLVVPKLLVRLREAIGNGEPEVASVPSPALNSGLQRLSRLEQRLFAHLPLPFGSSLYARLEAAATPA